MAATNAVIGYGTTLGIYNGATYDAVAEILTLQLPDFVRDAVEATNMASLGEVREYIAGLMGVGELTFEFNYIPSASDKILAAQVAGVGQFKIAFANSVNWVFKAIVTKYSPAVPLDDKMVGSVSLQVTGAGTWAAS